jgi:chromosome segregation ATPase
VDDSTFEKASAARDEIKNEVESIRSRYQALQLHADDTRERISRAMEESDANRPEIEGETTRWNSSVQRLLDWVESQEESLANQCAPSLDKTELKEQLERHRVSYLILFWGISFRLRYSSRLLVLI